MANYSSIIRFKYSFNEQQFLAMYSIIANYKLTLKMCVLNRQILRIKCDTIQCAMPNFTTNVSDFAILIPLFYYISAIISDLLDYTGNFVEWDPLLVGCEPSNPWMSDDTTYWELNKPM